MTKIGFDSEMYMQKQSEQILQRFTLRAPGGERTDAPFQFLRNFRIGAQEKFTPVDSGQFGNQDVRIHARRLDSGGGEFFMQFATQFKITAHPAVSPLPVGIWGESFA